MQAIKFKGYELELGKPRDWDDATQGPCDTLPIRRQDGMCISAWRPTWREKLSLIFGRGVVWLFVVSGTTQPPVALEIRREG